MDTNQATQWIADLGQQLGIGELALNEDGVCTLSIDDGRWLVIIGYHPSEGGLRLMICVDDLIPDAGQLAELMTAHFAWRESAGTTFALAPGSGALVLQRQVSDVQLAAIDLADTVALLVDCAEAWTARLTAAPEPAATDEAPVDARVWGSLA
ncbi:type III secretion system chaperone [Pseudothauera rhizosphaerae]|uniref:Type III secretion system chaperone n=1 Tax=Pseudothauera rhizosphaerae TaxID=2565932 RepID=A0A4S4AVW0_9RHOO|nr:type III secretion system chaperone [Pseudothauera rhizosphaerae]THF64111.1 type III secretion system chaperone [Pseudothauera rhizosphaerae]